MSVVNGIIGAGMIILGILFVLAVLLCLFILYDMCISDDNCVGCGGYPNSCHKCMVYKNMDPEIKDTWIVEDE